MSQRLTSWTKVELNNAAKVCATATGKPRPDRMCCRRRDALICFFCEVYPNFPEGLAPVSTAEQPRQQVSIDYSEEGEPEPVWSPADESLFVGLPDQEYFECFFSG
jgi:hypothetical protein